MYEIFIRPVVEGGVADDAVEALSDLRAAAAGLTSGSHTTRTAGLMLAVHR